MYYWSLLFCSMLFHIINALNQLKVMKEGKDDSADRCCENNSMELLLLMRHYLLLSNESNLL